MTTQLPVAIIGAGPIGLAAAARLHAAAESFVILEAGTGVGAAVRNWAHVRVFSPWRYIIDDGARALLTGTGWAGPNPEAYPTGGQIVDDYLVPLAGSEPICRVLVLNARVTSVARKGFDKLRSKGREAAPFAVIYQSAGFEHELLARAVIDASGTGENANPLGASGVAAPGERAGHARIRYGIPDALGAERARFAGAHTLVVGGGHSAFNALLDLARLADEAPGTRVTWAVRRTETSQMFGGGAADQLSARGELGERVRQILRGPNVTLMTGARIERITLSSAGIRASMDDGRVVESDQIVAATGFRPDLDMLRELRLSLDDRNEAPAALAPLIDPNLHSCGSVPPHGWAELKHAAEPGFYIVGMKSYGRAPTFLMLTGYEQVRSVVAAITGDMEAALDSRLVLPETGVCSGPGSGCCEEDGAIGATGDQTAGCGCNTGCCSTGSAPMDGLISIGELLAAPVARDRPQVWQWQAQETKGYQELVTTRLD